MPKTMDDILHPNNAEADPDFPHAPDKWVPADAVSVAGDEGLELTDDHWEIIRALQNYFSRHEPASIGARALHDALDENFHSRGGMKYLYQLLPGGPISQGCRLSGLVAPAGSSDSGFGSVQ